MPPGKLAAPVGLAGLLAGPRRPPPPSSENVEPSGTSMTVVQGAVLPEGWKQLKCSADQPLYQQNGYAIYTQPPNVDGTPPKAPKVLTAADKKWLNIGVPEEYLAKLKLGVQFPQILTNMKSKNPSLNIDKIKQKAINTGLYKEAKGEARLVNGKWVIPEKPKNLVATYTGPSANSAEADRIAQEAEYSRLNKLIATLTPAQISALPQTEQIPIKRRQMQLSKPASSQPASSQPASSQPASSEMGSAWVEMADKEFGTQFYNPSTKSIDDKVPNSDWVVPNWQTAGPDEAGDYWFYNPITQESLWELSPEILARPTPQIKKMQAPPRRGGKRKTQRRRKNKRSTYKYYKTK